MKLGIMQPYFFPYIGYFQLINAVDKFVIYDNIKYTKKGWFNRNRFLKNGKDEIFSIPIKKDSDYLNVDSRYISPAFNKIKLLNQIKEAYRKAPFFDNGFSLFEKCILNSEDNLFNYIFNSLKEICNYINIDTEFIISSDVNIDHQLQAQDKVLAICENLNTDTYINPIGGTELYQCDKFSNISMELQFIKTNTIEYRQFKNTFVPSLSIIDMIMFNDLETLKIFLENYELL